MRPIRRTSLVLVVLSTVVSLPGGSLGAATKTRGPLLSLPTAQHERCVKPRPMSQTVTLPSTGGITATLTFGPFPKGATQCLPVVIGTGDDILDVSGPPAAPAIARFASAIPVSAPPSGSPTPLLTVTVGAGTNASSIIPYGRPILLTGTKLSAAASLKLADGIYIATVRRSDGSRSSAYPNLQFIAKNGVLRVAPIEVIDTDAEGTAQTKKSFPIMQFVDASSTISLYPLGVTPPEPTEDPSDTTTPGDTTPGTKRPAVSTTLPPVPPHGPAMKGAFGLPPPDWGTVIGSLTWEWANCRSSELCRWTSNVISGGGFDTALNVPGNFEGEVNFSLNIGYMILRQVTYENCPKNWSVFANYTGVGSLTIAGITPNSTPGGYCKIRLSTIPKGRNGSGYELVLAVSPISTGDRPT